MIDTVAIRNSVLRLAFSGHLTERTDTDDSVEDLLLRISPKKSIVQDDGLPYEIPSEWARVRLADLYKINPKVEAEENIEAAFIPMEKISPGYEDEFTYETQSWGQASKNHTKFQNDDVAFAKISPCFENRKSFIARELPNGIGGGTTELIILRQKEMVPEYTYYLVLDQRFINTGAASYKGTVGQQRVQSDVVKNYVVPVPSVAEQKRIVKKISEAFSILDEIDALQEQYASNQEALKSKLIDAAIQGKLKEQLPEDGTAEELRADAIEYKDELAKQGVLKNRKNKDIREITEEDCIFELPASWSWFRLGEIIEVFGRIGFRGYKKTDLVQKGQGAITMSPSNISRSGKISFDDSTYISWEKYEESPEIMLEEGDVVLVKTGSTYGKSGIIKALPEKATINPQLAILKYIKCDRDYLAYVLQSSMAWTQYQSFVVGAATPTFSQEKIANMMIPMPPMAEQKRIVDALNTIMGIIENQRMA